MSFKQKAFDKLEIITIVAAATAYATAAPADSIQLAKPSQAASLHEDGVYMTVYYLDHAGPLEVVATFSDEGSARPPSQLRMSLIDGDDLGFTVPDRPDVTFRFTREGQRIDVGSQVNDLGDFAAK